MQQSFLTSSSLTTSFCPLSCPSNSQRVQPLFGNPCRSSLSSPSGIIKPLNYVKLYGHAIPALQSTVYQEIVDTSNDESEFIEIGYICNVHGLQGDLRVKPSTGFPELRFSEPGRRWLRERVLGSETIREVELVEGRGHPGQNSWIISLNGIDSVDKAKQLVGSTLLVREQDRPVLEEGEFYTPDLVGMRVILKDTGKPVGTVVNVFNNGASDLLHVMLTSAEEMLDRTGSLKSETSVSSSLVWVPFVEAIVPDVDMIKREMHITPPKGLLELNLRADGRSKKERRLLEWKQRKKLIAVKKKLCEIKQQHIFHGFRFGEKSQRSFLADQIVDVKVKFLQQALKNIEMPSKRWNFSELINANSTEPLKNPLKVSKDCLVPFGSDEKLDRNHELQEKGLHLMSKGKVAIILMVEGNNNPGKESEPDIGNSESCKDLSDTLLEALLTDTQRFPKAGEECISVPLIMVSPTKAIRSFQQLFSDNDYFAFDSKKVWFLEEEKLPVISSSPEEQNRHKILMKSPWEILSSSMGSGGVFSLLLSHNILENFKEIGVEYVQICRLNQRSVAGYQLFSGYVDSRKADVGIRIIKDKEEDFEEDFDMIFSMKFLKKILEQINELHFYGVAKQNSHVEKVDKEWVDVVPTSSNSYELRSSIYSSLNICSPDKICVMEVQTD